jgi:hypothetical protein
MGAILLSRLSRQASTRDRTSNRIARKQLSTHELRVRRMRRQERLVEFMCRRRGVPFELKYRDYRFWECVSCGFNADNDAIFGWFSNLHWRAREELLVLSRFDRRSARLFSTSRD